MADALRAGHSRHLPARELVPGDIVLLASGARIPADVRLLKAIDLRINESALTGESVAAGKDPDRVLDKWWNRRRHTPLG